ncbi:MAG: ABC transporter [Erythrobacter sp.]
MLVLLALLLAACSPGQGTEEIPAKPRVGLFTSLPIYWGEGDFGALLDGESEKDWVRAELETRFELVPLDTLEPEALDGLDRVILAQPRALAPSENASFDDWVAGGGRAVILADPMLTRHSDYPIGDRRRPQDVVLLSPILSHWGVELLFDEAQARGERLVEWDGRTFPVNLRGSFVPVDKGRSMRACEILADGLAARCRRSAGEAFLFADAALLDWEGTGPVPEVRRDALWDIVSLIASPNPPSAD